MRIRLKPVGRPQPFLVVRVPSAWEALTETARQRVYADLSPGASVHLLLADGAEVLSLDDIEADDERGTRIRTRAYARECSAEHGGRPDPHPLPNIPNPNNPNPNNPNSTPNPNNPNPNPNNPNPIPNNPDPIPNNPDPNPNNPDPNPNTPNPNPNPNPSQA